MAIWRLIAHHADAESAIHEMNARGRIAIGWSSVGDISKANINEPADISALISEADSATQNAGLGGPSLWNFYSRMQEGDLVILNAGGKRSCVYQVMGPYIYEGGAGQIMGYAHQRSACLTSIDPNELWHDCGAEVAEGQNIRWALAECSETTKTKLAALNEGARYSVISTVIERSPIARKLCIEYHGCRCAVCGFDFGSTYGELGDGYIHVHHKTEISSQAAQYQVDPINDLVPLCPNCHAMAHKLSPPVCVDALREIVQQAIAKKLLPK